MKKKILSIKRQRDSELITTGYRVGEKMTDNPYFPDPPSALSETLKLLPEFQTLVSKISQVSIFSGLNNLMDLTLDENYAGICGYNRKNWRLVSRNILIKWQQKNQKPGNRFSIK
ncbi:AAA family ATPase [Niastella populi]|uniref:Uncharacterized protein n=1 Tax=Niastella populi TaxID=550983 RepID=A0A1V9FNB6_9BACT|nr:hypothetical protein A4R26_20890 [Niastella populi]